MQAKNFARAIPQRYNGATGMIHPHWEKFKANMAIHKENVHHKCSKHVKNLKTGFC
jgi:hypothetical protein